ncbi:hypothetical protein AB0K52_18345 [Glycomyces sp. NPDC049804]|uniref:hypothetical protein n=1 Tax=Glycomyces sp. NPDC049804 TaxID=3154363 RepID=UPI003449B01C
MTHRTLVGAAVIVAAVVVLAVVAVIVVVVEDFRNPPEDRTGDCMSPRSVNRRGRFALTA